MHKRDRVRQLKKRIGQVWMEPAIEDGKVVLIVASNKGLYGVIQDEDIDPFLDECESMQHEGYHLADTEACARAYF